MTSELAHIVCPQCHAVNRLPRERLGEAPICGRCQVPLFSGHPVTLTQDSLMRHIERNGVPVVVDFWAPWCGPCKVMAPAFEAAAAQLEPRVRLAKINTQEQPTVADKFSIRSIPTLVVFNGGREVARQSGAMALPQLIAWIRHASS